MTSQDYRMTFGYGLTTPPYGSPQFPYHRGEDYFMPDGTPIIVNGVLIGISGHSGFVDGPHCHIGRFINSNDTNPAGRGWTLNNPVVTDTGYDDINGNYVGLRDAEGVRWVYLHMHHQTVGVGDVLANLPKFNEGGYSMAVKEPDDYRINRGDVQNIKGWLGLPVNDGDYGFVGQTWKEFATAILTGAEWQGQLKVYQGQSAMANLVDELKKAVKE